MLKRKDFAINLAKIYLDTPVLSIEEYQEQSLESNTIIDFIVLETVLAVPQVFDLFEEDEAQALITVARNKSEEKQKNEKIYGGSYDWFFTVRQAVSGRISRNGFATVFTPRSSSVVITVSAKEFTTEERNQINADYKRRYPEATIVAPASRKYSCHSYAWYLSSTNNKYWMDDPSKYMSDGSYLKLNYANAKSGAKMYWTGKEHSGNVVSVNSSAANGSKCTIELKWGSGPVMRHKENYSLYNNTRTIWGR